MKGLAGSLLAAVVALLSATAPAAAQQPTAEEILARATAAIGGRERWDAVQTLTCRGTFSAFSRQYPFVLERKRPNLYRFEHHEADIAVTLAFDGARAWWDYDWIPFSEVDWPTDPPFVYSQGFAADAEFAFAFLDSASRGHRPSLRGRVDFEGTDSWEVDLTLASGSTETWYFDASSYLPVARVSKAGYVGLPAELRTFFSDWRQLSGLLLPYRIESELGNRFALMLLEEAVINPPIDDARFRLPLDPAMVRLADLAGTWQVAVESHPLPNMPWFPSTGTATITALNDGRVLEEDLAFTFSGKPRSVRRLITFNRFRSELQLVHVDSLTNHPILLRGPASGLGEEPLRVAATNLGTDSAWGVWNFIYHNRYVLHELTPVSFRIDWDVTTDGGATWGTLARFHYTRKPPGAD